MGIHNLAKLIGDYAASAIKENEMKNYFLPVNIKQNMKKISV